MGVFDKLAFWKKKDDFDLGKGFGSDLDMPSAGPEFGSKGPDLGLHQPPGAGRDLGLGQANNIGMPEDIGFGNLGKQPQPSMQPPGQHMPMQQPLGQTMPMQQPFAAPVQPPAPTQKDYSNNKFEVVSAKLDSIRYTLESINQRLTNIERVAYGEHESSSKKRW